MPKHGTKAVAKGNYLWSQNFEKKKPTTDGETVTFMESSENRVTTTEQMNKCKEILIAFAFKSEGELWIMVRICATVET